jgi:hypothetical protein
LGSQGVIIHRQTEPLVFPSDTASIWRLCVSLAVTALVLLGLFALAARRRYYFHLVPFTAGFAILTGLQLQLAGLAAFVWWYLGLSAVMLFVGLLRHLSSDGGREAFSRLRSQVLEAVPDGEMRRKVARELAPGRAIIQDALVDVVVFAVFFVAASYGFSRIL